MLAVVPGPRTPNALLVIRAWTEEGSPSPLRIELRHTLDVTRGISDSEWFSDDELVQAAVRAWLEDVLRGRDAAVTMP
jgi:hypothetical protein